MKTAFDLATGQPWLITEEALRQILAIAERQNLDPALAAQLADDREARPEAVAMKAPGMVVQKLDELGLRRIRLAIDDFGTGYSSLSYLKRFRINKIKIDQSFVRDITVDPDDQAIVVAIIQMAHGLGMGTIAEGVETAEQLNFLRRRGCEEAQGYYFSRPLPAAEFERFVRERRGIPSAARSL